VQVREKYGLPQDYVLFVGTLEPRKNLRRLIEALRKCSADLPLVVAGAHGWGDDITQECRRVQFIGFVPDGDLPSLYSGARVFCYPSEREGFGMPVLEAMSYGVPVVTSRGTSTEEVAGGAAVLVDPYSVDDIARGIESALRDSETLSFKGLRQAARHRWSETARLTVQAYREALDG
jgi:glycosyltransferase involved in cell wall biosynthesis